MNLLPCLMIASMSSVPDSYDGMMLLPVWCCMAMSLCIGSRRWTFSLPFDTFHEQVNHICWMVTSFSQQELFEAGQRQWASSTQSSWPGWKDMG